MELCDGDLSRLTTKHIGQAANAGDDLACSVLLGSIEVLGWAIAQVETLLAPEVVVVGGGVSLIGEEHFLTPLRDAVDRYVFPPLRGSFEILPAKLGEDAVVYGAIANAARQRD